MNQVMAVGFMQKEVDTNQFNVVKHVLNGYFKFKQLLNC
jgi:hypothetical protein